MNVGFQIRKLVNFRIISLKKRTLVNQGGVKPGSVIQKFFLCQAGFNKNEFTKTGTSFLMCAKNICLPSDNTLDLSINFGVLRSRITEPEPVTRVNVGLPFIDFVENGLKLPTERQRELIDPNSNVVEKKAKKSLIRIKRRKMRRHKHKKLQKRMRLIFAKIKSRRRAKKEKIFLKMISSIIETGNDYDPEKEVNENLKILKWQRPVTHIRGFLAPKSVVEEYLKEEELRNKIKERVEECLKKL